MTRNDGQNNYDVIATKLEYIRRDIDEIKSEVRGSFVTKDEFEPIKKLVYGLVGLILIAVVGAIVGLVIIK